MIGSSAAGDAKAEDADSLPSTPRQTRTHREVLDGFSLGWHVAELYLLKVKPEKPADDIPDDLPGIGDLSSGLRADLLATQIAVNLRQLAAIYKQYHGVDIPTDELLAKSGS